MASPVSGGSERRSVLDYVANWKNEGQLLLPRRHFCRKRLSQDTFVPNYPRG